LILRRLRPMPAPARPAEAPQAERARQIAGLATQASANPEAVAVLKENIALNGLKRCVVREMDLNLFFLKSRERFDFVEIDPFGSPAPFLENAFRRLKKKAVLSVTSTDLAKLYGSSRNTCRRVYDAMPLKTFYGHELAARILLGRIARTAASLDFGVSPLFCFYRGHFVKAFVFCEKGAFKADESLRRVGFWSHCFNCGGRSAGARENCSCGKAYAVGGPAWLGSLCEEKFLQSMLEKAKSKQARKLLELLAAENSAPVGFFDLHEEYSILKKEPLPNREVIRRLREKGFSNTPG
jgi:tRNA (guanine26-N2/guanine27-N2)-dimethyltransferase